MIVKGGQRCPRPEWIRTRRRSTALAGCAAALVLLVAALARAAPPAPPAEPGTATQRARAAGPANSTTATPTDRAATDHIPADRTPTDRAAAPMQVAWPTRPIRLVVPYPAGGPLDLTARALAQSLRVELGQPVIVDNRPGAGGNIGADVVAKAKPDGYAIVMGAVATHAINPFLYARMPYDPNRDFTAITRIAVVPNVLVMTPATLQRLGVASLAELIAYARRHPGKLTLASGGNGSAGHLAGALLEQRAGIRLLHVPYQGAAPAKADLLAGQTDLMFDNLASAAPQIQTGELRALAVTSRERDALAPQVPTVGEGGIEDFDISTWFALFGPADLAPAVRDRLYHATTAALNGPAVTQTLAQLGAAAAPLSPPQFEDFVRAEQAKYANLVRHTGVSVD